MSTEKHPFMIKLQQIHDEVLGLKRQLKLNEIKNPEHIFLDNADVAQMFKVTSKTVSNWRSKGIIKHQVIGGKIYYKLSDIQSLFKDKQKT